MSVLDGNQPLRISVGRRTDNFTSSVSDEQSFRQRQRNEYIGGVARVEEITTPSTDRPVVNVIVSHASPESERKVIRRIKKVYTLNPSTSEDEPAVASEPAAILSPTPTADAESELDPTPTTAEALSIASPPAPAPTSRPIPIPRRRTETISYIAPPISPLTSSLETMSITPPAPVYVQSNRTSQASNSTTRSNRSNRTNTTNSSLSSATSRALQHQTHSFESCPHTSPPHNRPLNAQPHFIQNPTHDPLSPRHATLPQFISTIPGACHACDTSRRRTLEAAILDAYAASAAGICREIEDFAAKARSGAVGARDEVVALEAELESLRGQERREVTGVWKGYSARWGPGAVGVERELGGRMRVSWIRPDNPGSGSGSRSWSKRSGGGGTRRPKSGSSAIKVSGWLGTDENWF